MENSNFKKIELDWSRLLGFDQAEDIGELVDGEGAKRVDTSSLSTKFGGKPGNAIYSPNINSGMFAKIAVKGGVKPEPDNKKRVGAK